MNNLRSIETGSREITSKERAYRWLKEQIVGGKLSFGTVLSPRRMGQEIGMSFLPVSDALQRLEDEGLVESRDRVGTRVKVPTVEDIRGVFTLREALESQAARLSCERATQDQRRELRSLAREVDARYGACRSPSTSRAVWSETNAFHMKLHRLIAEAAHCPRLLTEIERSQVLTIKVQFDNALFAKKRPANWHRSLVSAILGGDPLRADAAARLHIRYGIAEVVATVAQLEVNQRWRA